MKVKYVVKPPVDGGYAFWNVSRPQNLGGPSFEEITIHRDVPGAADIANSVCEALNAGLE